MKVSAHSVDSFSHVGAERELFKQIARKSPSPSRMRASLRALGHGVQFVLPSTPTAPSPRNRVQFLLIALASCVLEVTAALVLSLLLSAG
jgi:hypothetical protein